MTISRYGNSYTFQIIGDSAPYAEFEPAITAAATEAIEYTSRYVDWHGTLDFVVDFRPPAEPGTDAERGLMPSYVGFVFDAAQGGFRANALLEGTSGVDRNNATATPFDAGGHLIPSSNGALSNYGLPFWFGDGVAFPARNPPAGTADFASVYLHEIMHSFGLAIGDLTYASFVSTPTVVPAFDGPHTVELLGQSLRLNTAQRDHYSGPVDRGLMYEFGNYEQNAIELGQLDLMMLKDLG